MPVQRPPDQPRGPDVRLRVPARPNQVLVVRELVRGLEASLLSAPGLSQAMQTAISEAANNVVTHAYPDGDGVLEVDLRLGGRVEAIVRDRGWASTSTRPRAAVITSG